MEKNTHISSSDVARILAASQVKPTENVRMSLSQAKHRMREKTEMSRKKEMDEEKWVQLVAFVALVDGPQSFRSTGRAEKAPVMTC